jgi:hypothetical protein
MTRRYLLSLSLVLPLLAGCWCVTRDDIEVAPPVPPSSAVACRDAYGKGVGKAFLAAAAEYRKNTPEKAISDQIANATQDLPEAAWKPLMRELNSAPNREAKAALYERWGVELGGAD